MGIRQTMKSTTIFSSKAEKYARFRWTYAPDCICAIIEMTRISRESIVADLGAGTGILTKEFAGIVKRVFAVEPNSEMRAILAKELEHFPACQIVDGSAEGTTLADNSIDLVTVAQAIHWFEPAAARQEFRRILRPGGWLAICRNYGTDESLGNAISKVYPAETDTSELMIGKSTPRSFYFCGSDYMMREFPFRTRVGWAEFLGALGTASYAPDEGGDLYPDFERRAKQVFDRFSSNGVIEQGGTTELYLGQIQCQQN